MKFVIHIDLQKYAELNNLLNDITEEIDCFSFVLSVGEKRELTKNVVLERTE